MQGDIISTKCLPGHNKYCLWKCHFIGWEVRFLYRLAFFSFLFRDRVFLCGLGCPGTHYRSDWPKTQEIFLPPECMCAHMCGMCRHHPAQISFSMRQFYCIVEKGSSRTSKGPQCFSVSRLPDLEEGRSTLIQGRTKGDSQVFHLSWVGEMSYRAPSHLCTRFGDDSKLKTPHTHITQKIRHLWKTAYRFF